MTIRRAEPADQAELACVFLAARRAAFHWCDPAEFCLEDYPTQTAGELVWLAADEAGQILGFISIWEADRFVHHLFVDPAHQGRGVGTQLLHSLPDWLPGPYRLKCDAPNVAARAFYAKRGWRELGPVSPAPDAPIVLEWRPLNNPTGGASDCR